MGLKSLSPQRPIYILNGPNLNRLGEREPEIYGGTTLKQVEAQCRQAAGKRPIEFRQTNHEGQLVDWIHEAIDRGSGIVINPAGYSFTSIAILDALKMFPGPIVELHITNIHRREALYHRSLISKVATAVIAGLGAEGYAVAVRALEVMLRRRAMPAVQGGPVPLSQVRAPGGLNFRTKQREW